MTEVINYKSRSNHVRYNSRMDNKNVNWYAFVYALSL